MTFENLESLELEPMKFNAFKVCSELTSRMDGVPMLNGFMKSQTSLPKSELILNKEVYFKTFITATPTKKHLISGNNYFSVLQDFITDISKSEESKFPADLVTFTKEILDGKLHFWVKCHLCRYLWAMSETNIQSYKIPKLMPGFLVDDYHYLSATKMPSKMNGKERVIHDFQLHVEVNPFMMDAVII